VHSWATGLFKGIPGAITKGTIEPFGDLDPKEFCESSDYTTLFPSLNKTMRGPEVVVSIHESIQVCINVIHSNP
jgi:hypothetical protein